MARLEFRNRFGTQASRLDPQRPDLFKLTIIMPEALQRVSNLTWQDVVEFAVERFPFPERSRDFTAIKYMQQTNWLIGGDTQMGPIDVPIRYVFAEQTAELLEKWFWMVSNPRTGGIGLTTQCKGKGYMRWIVPDMNAQLQDLRQNVPLGSRVISTTNEGLTYELEGCLIKGLKYSDANMTESGYVTLQFNLSVDRYYPVDINNMQVLTGYAA